MKLFCWTELSAFLDSGDKKVWNRLREMEASGLGLLEFINSREDWTVISEMGHWK